MTIAFWIQLLIMILQFLLEHVLPAAAGAAAGVVAARTTVARKAAKLVVSDVKAGIVDLAGDGLEASVRRYVKQVQAEVSSLTKKT